MFLYGLDKAKVDIKKKGAVFVEGQVDVLTAYQSGITNVVASSGTALTAAQLRIISRYTKEIIFCFDSDEAGMAATSRALDLTNQFDLEVKVLVLPDKYKDLDEYLIAAPSDAKGALSNPIPVYDFFMVRALRKFSKDTAYGKKRIVEMLAPIFSKISNNVVKDHYTKELAEKIGVSEDAIRDAFVPGAVRESRSKPEET